MSNLFNVLEGYCAGKLGLDASGNQVVIPEIVGNLVHYVYIGIQILVPIMLIIFGMIDLARSITSQKEDEIKKAQSGLLKKAIVAALVFLLFSLVRFVVSFAGGDQSAWGCAEALINGTKGSTAQVTQGE